MQFLSRSQIASRPNRTSPSPTSSIMDSDADDRKSQPQQEPPSKKKSKKNKRKRDTPPEPVPVPVPVQIQAKVQVVHENSKKTPPIIGYFPSGFDPVKSSGSTGFQFYRNRNMTKRLELVVSPAGSPVEFVGTSYSGEAAAGHRAMYALGVFDKEAQTLKVVPIAANKIFRLDPKVKGLGAAANSEPAKSTLEELSPEQNAVKLRQATAMWGTKKEIEKAKKRLALKQDDEPDSRKNLDLKMKNIVVNEKAIESTEAHVSRNIPPYDASATTPQEAYLLDKIILKGEWDYLEDVYNILQRREAADFSDYPTFICNRIEKLKNIKDESEKRKISCIFSYINHLIKFKDQHSMDGVSSAKNHKIPNILRHKFTTMFDVSDSKRLPSEKINLLISYILVLTLFSDEFQTDYTDVAKDLRMNFLAVRELYKHLGCKISSSRKNNVFRVYATLPVPLKFPDLKKSKFKR